MAVELERLEHRGIAGAEFTFDGDLVSTGFHPMRRRSAPVGFIDALDGNATSAGQNDVAADSESNWDDIDPLAVSATGTTTRIT